VLEAMLSLVHSVNRCLAFTVGCLLLKP